MSLIDHDPVNQQSYDVWKVTYIPVNPTKFNKVCYWIIIGIMWESSSNQNFMNYCIMSNWHFRGKNESEPSTENVLFIVWFLHSKSIIPFVGIYLRAWLNQFCF